MLIMVMAPIICTHGAGRGGALASGNLGPVSVDEVPTCTCTVAERSLGHASIRACRRLDKCLRFESWSRTGR